MQSLDNKLDNLNDLRQAGNFNQASYLSDPDVLKDQVGVSIHPSCSIQLLCAVPLRRTAGLVVLMLCGDCTHAIIVSLDN